jgi:hypothetical protein
MRFQHGHADGRIHLVTAKSDKYIFLPVWLLDTRMVRDVNAAREVKADGNDALERGTTRYKASPRIPRVLNQLCCRMA